MTSCREWNWGKMGVMVRGREWGDWRRELLTVDDLPWDDHGTSFLKVTGYFQLLILTYLVLCIFYSLNGNIRLLPKIKAKHYISYETRCNRLNVYRIRETWIESISFLVNCTLILWSRLGTFLFFKYTQGNTRNNRTKNIIF